MAIHGLPDSPTTPQLAALDLIRFLPFILPQSIAQQRPLNPPPT
jgi:hypothetical protein